VAIKQSKISPTISFFVEMFKSTSDTVCFVLAMMAIMIMMAVSRSRKKRTRRERCSVLFKIMVLLLTMFPLSSIVPTLNTVLPTLNSSRCCRRHNYVTKTATARGRYGRYEWHALIANSFIDDD